MRRSFILAMLFAGALHLHAMAQPGWTTLLDGTSLKGWIVVGDANWAAVDGAVQAHQGRQVSRDAVVMNGTTTVDVEHKGHARGAVALQYGEGASMVRFRNVRIRTL